MQVISVIEFLIRESETLDSTRMMTDEKRCLSELIEKIRAEINELESKYAMH